MPEENENIGRTPITAGAQPKAEVVAVLKPLELSFFLPAFEYQLQGKQVSTEAADLKAVLQAFLEENQELITNGVDVPNIENLDVFAKGFRNAIALVNLWVDSMYVTGE